MASILSASVYPRFPSVVVIGVVASQADSLEMYFSAGIHAVKMAHHRSKSKHRFGGASCHFLPTTTFGDAGAVSTFFSECAIENSPAN